MTTIHPYVAQQFAHEYTRDRIRQAEIHRIRRAAGAARRERRSGARGNPPRRSSTSWTWFVPGRTTTA